MKTGKKSEVSIYKDTIRKPESQTEKMIVEDIAALDKISEERVLDELQIRLENGDSYTYVGDVLLSLNSNDLPSEYERCVSNFL